MLCIKCLSPSIETSKNITMHSKFFLFTLWVLFNLISWLYILYIVCRPQRQWVSFQLMQSRQLGSKGGGQALRCVRALSSGVRSYAALKSVNQPFQRDKCQFSFVQRMFLSKTICTLCKIFLIWERCQNLQIKDLRSIILRYLNVFHAAVYNLSDNKYHYCTSPLSYLIIQKICSACYWLQLRKLTSAKNGISYNLHTSPCIA